MKQIIFDLFRGVRLNAQYVTHEQTNDLTLMG